MWALWWATWAQPFYLYSFIDNPYGIGGDIGAALRTLGSLGTVLALVSLLASAISVFVRFDNSRGEERQQLKWSAYAAAVLIGDFFIVVPPTQALGGPGAAFVFLMIGLLGVLVALGVTILKYRLYDIDRIINRTLVYSSLTATLALIYISSVVSLQAVLRVLTGQESTFAVVASALVIAALFAPLRRLVQAFVDRRFYRRKYDAARTLEALNVRLRDETDLDALSNVLVGGVARSTLQPEHISL